MTALLKFEKNFVQTAGCYISYRKITQNKVAWGIKKNILG